MSIPSKIQSMQRKPAPLLAPRFGPLSGMRVLCTGSIVAGPFGPTLLADYGAEVIHVEAPGYGDTYRTLGPFLVTEDGRRISLPFSNDARNKLFMTLNLRLKECEECREVFLGLIKQSDLWFENLVWLEERYGITMETVFEVNPKIVVVRISGYGHAKHGGGLPEYSRRASYDLIGQAFSGWPEVVAFPDTPPRRVPLWAGDYITALFATIGGLAAYINAQKTGKGQVVDVAQFEVIARILESYFTSYLNAGILRPREPNKAASFQPYDIFRAKDGWVAVGAFGPAVYNRFIKALAEATGIDLSRYPWEKCAATREAVESQLGRELDEITRKWISEHTVREVEELMAKYDVPCTRVMRVEDAVNHPHWVLRNNFVEAFDEWAGKTLKYFGVVPKFTETPGKVWRGSPPIGGDTEKILKELLDYSDDEIRKLKEKKVI